jgi:hypothetical protein
MPEAENRRVGLLHSVSVGGLFYASHQILEEFLYQFLLLCPLLLELVLNFAITTLAVGVGDRRRGWYFWHAILRMFEDLCFQNQAVRGMQSAMRRSAAEGQGKYQVFLVDDWEDVCEYR